MEKEQTKKKHSLVLPIFISLGLAIIAGLLLRGHADWAVKYIKPFGTIFLNLLQFIVCPIVLFSIMCGVTSMKDIRKVASIGWKSLLYFLITTILAVVIGLLVGKLFSGIFPQIGTATIKQVEVTDVNPMQAIINMFPSNFFVPLVEANMLQVIVMALLLGFSMVLLGEKGEPIIKAVNTLNDLFLKCMSIILMFTPIGVFCLLTPVIASTGPKVIGSLGAVLGAAYLAFCVQLALVYGGSVGLSGALNPIKFFKYMAPTMAFAFSSASSVGSISINMKSCEKMGADKDVTAFVLPLGATINMGGTAIYMGICSVFISSCYGIHLSFAQVLTIVGTAVISSIGTAGVPGSGMIMLSMVLASAGLPVEGVAIVAGIDRIFDMGRTVVNISGDSACSVIVSHIERKKAAKDLPKADATAA